MEDVIDRLGRLYPYLSEEGWHAKADTVALAIEEITRLRKLAAAVAEHFADTDAPLGQMAAALAANGAIAKATGDHK